MTLKGKRVLILGGTSGIGLAVAKAAKAEGSDVVVVSSKQSRVDAALTLLGEGAEGYVANLSNETAVDALFGKMGPFDQIRLTRRGKSVCCHVSLPGTLPQNRTSKKLFASLQFGFPEQTLPHRVSCGVDQACGIGW
jgi:hypothetical protein